MPLIHTLRNYLSLVKFSHTIFALPFAFIGFWLGLAQSGASFSWKLFLLMLACMVFARSAAMAFNRYADREFDRKNPRTFLREIPSGIIAPSSALRFVLLNVALFWICTWFINPLCFALAPVALLVVLGYSYTKRFTALCHLVLGLGLSLAPIGAYLCITGTFALAPLLFSGAVLFWVSGFDVLYALQDEDFDRSQGLRSLPVLLGAERALRLSRFLHILCSACILGAGWYAHLGFWYGCGTALFMLLLVYQHSLVKPHDLSRINLAFFTTNGIASVAFALFFLLDRWQA
jgi:4-hydroxybenzoate polyprenyltransferase